MSRKLTLALIVAVCCGTFAATQPNDPLRERAKRLHRSIVVLDTHADMSALFAKDGAPPKITDAGMAGSGYDPTADAEKYKDGQSWTKDYPPGAWNFAERHKEGFLDLPRMREGGLNAQFFSIYMEREPQPGMAVKRSLDYIDAVRSLCRKYSKDIALATTAQEVRDIVRSGRIAALMGMEGGHMIEDDLRVLRLYHLLGVRYLTLTHCFNTNWGDSSGCGGTPPPAQHNGLSPFGREVVKELNRLGIIVDITHTADKTFYDAVAVSQAPVIASHSSVDGIKEHARNMSDDMLKALARNGGVIQVNAVIKYIDPNKPPDKPIPAPGDSPISVFIDHIAHAVKVAGPDHVGIGIDFGYTAPTPVGLRDVSHFENVTYELLKRGFDEATVKKIWGENTLRVMAQVERVAAAQQSGQ